MGVGVFGIKHSGGGLVDGEHRDVDLDRIYRDADLVVDTVNSSAGRSPRVRQVLRLGAGWSPA